LQAIQLLQHRHGDGHLVLLEVQRRVGVMDQHIGVQDIENRFCGVIHWQSPSLTGTGVRLRPCFPEDSPRRLLARPRGRSRAASTIAPADDHPATANGADRWSRVPMLPTIAGTVYGGCLCYW